MYQSWRNLLFLHWAWDPQEIQRTLPAGLQVDTFDGKAWLGVVPFWMDAVRPRFCPAVPGISWFLELNLRTYVHSANGTPGVWFYSLDCNQPMAVWLARTFFSLPYVHATQSGKFSAAENSSVTFQSRRRGAPESSAFVYSGIPEYAAKPALVGTLEYFLVERYLLFAWQTRTQRLRSGRVWHQPYRIRPANVQTASTPLFTDNGFETPARPADHAMVSPGVDVSIYRLK